MRPIDADALKGAFANLEFHGADSRVKETGDWLLEDVIPSEIDAAPTLDVVPVVLCEDCRFAEKRHYLGDTFLYCKQFDVVMDEAEFCSRAERNGEKNAAD